MPGGPLVLVVERGTERTGAGGASREGMGKGRGGQERGDGDAYGAETASAALAASVDWGARSCTRVHSLRPQSTPCQRRNILFRVPSSPHSPPPCRATAGQRWKPVGKGETGRAGCARNPDGRTAEMRRGRGNRSWTILPRFTQTRAARRKRAALRPCGMGKRAGRGATTRRYRRQHRRRCGPWAPAAGSSSAAHPGHRPGWGR